MAGGIRFHGAVRNVTGSRHVLAWSGETVLLECGLVQGRRRQSNEANRELPFDPKEIDHMILSHAHIDHSGCLPVLVRDGYRGKIWCTRGTADLATILLRDSGHIQEADARHLNKRRAKDAPKIEPVYTQADAERVVPRFRSVDYRQHVALSENISFTLLDAGHILGSAMVVLRLRDGDKEIRVGFTGDHGRRNMPILRDPVALPPVDYLITESTYGDRLHPSEQSLEESLRELINENQRGAGRILIPAFAVGRTQNLVYSLGRLRRRGEIPEVPIFVDSPLAREATRVVAAHPDIYDGQIRKMMARGEDPLYFKGVRYVRDVEESRGLNGFDQPCIIISASGMCESGRILHHLKRSIGREQDCVLIVGYQARHTLGRRLVCGDKEVRIFGKPYRVRCKVRVMNGLSAHADYHELLESLRHLASDVRRTFIVHGDEDASFALKGRLEEIGFRDPTVPEEGTHYPLEP